MLVVVRLNVAVVGEIVLLAIIHFLYSRDNNGYFLGLGVMHMVGIGIDVCFVVE